MKSVDLCVILLFFVACNTCGIRGELQDVRRAVEAAKAAR